MTEIQKSDMIMMGKTGAFSIKEIAAHTGVPEFDTAKWLLRVGTIKRRVYIGRDQPAAD